MMVRCLRCNRSMPNWMYRKYHKCASNTVTVNNATPPPADLTPWYTTSDSGTANSDSSSSDYSGGGGDFGGGGASGSWE